MNAVYRQKVSCDGEFLPSYMYTKSVYSSEDCCVATSSGTSVQWAKYNTAVQLVFSREKKLTMVGTNSSRVTVPSLFKSIAFKDALA